MGADDHDWIVVKLKHGIIRYYFNEKGQMIFTAKVDPGYELRLVKDDDITPDDWEIVPRKNNA